MQAYIINQFGHPDVFQLAELPTPKIKEDEVLIKVLATSINPVDCKFRRGESPGAIASFPFVLHFDVSGIIEKVGSQVKHLKIGDEVYGMVGGINSRQGCLAEYVTAPALMVAIKPKNLSFLESAAVPLAGLTAWEALFLSVSIKQQDKILIYGGTGGVGHFALQLAKYLGAQVYATVGNEQKAEIAKSLGADITIQYRNESVADYVEKYTQNQGFNIVFDTVGGSNFDNSIQAAAPRGHLITSLGRATHNLMPAALKGLHLHLLNVTHPLTLNKWQETHQTALNTYTQLIEENKIRVLLDKQNFKISEVIKAHEFFESGQHIGKVCLEW